MIYLSEKQKQYLDMAFDIIALVLLYKCLAFYWLFFLTTSFLFFPSVNFA